MRDIGKLLLKEFIIVICCAIFGVVALTITYFIPQEDMCENVRESAIILHNEGLGAHIWDTISETMLDAYTDGLMLNVSYTETDDGIRDILLGTWVEVEKDTHGINPMESLYEVIALANDDYHIINYGRYWHGYQIILRPLLCFYTYADIRQFNMILQLALVFIFVYILARSEDKMLIIPFWGMYSFLSPLAIFSSFQYSACFYAMMFSLIILFGFRKRLKDASRNYLFLLVGIMTAFFDLLTYPFITLGVPLIAYLASDYECLISFKKGIREVFFYTMSWGIGYVGMWASKWIIASLFTNENVIGNAIEQLKFRSGHYSHKDTWFSTMKLNLAACNKEVLLLIFIGLVVCFIVSRIKHYGNMHMKICLGTLVILLVSCYSLIWYYFTMEHSSCHAHFTWRELGISVFGILTIGVINLQRKNVCPKQQTKPVVDNRTD